MTMSATALDIALAAWGDPLPDWIEVLARKCLEMPQTRVAERIGYSPAVVSQLLRQRYKGNLAAVEEAIRGAWMGATVRCPAVGLMRGDVCRSWQKKSREFKSTNSHRVRMYWACKDCPLNHNRKENSQ